MGSLNDLIVKVGMDVSEFVGGTVQISRELEGVAKSVDKNFAALDAFGGRLTSLGTAMTGAFTLPLAGLAAFATKAAVDFDEASDRIRNKTGATGEALQGLNTIFRDVFSTLPVSVNDASEAIAALATRTGLAGKPLEDLVTQELNLARVTETAVTPLIEATTRAFGDWSIATELQGEKLDFLFKVSQGTGLNITKLTELVVQFGAPMRALGFDFEHAAVMLGRFEKEGVNIETIMPGLRQELGNFAKAGIDAATGFASIIDSMKNAKTESEGLTIAMQVFGKRAATDMFRAVKEGRFDLDEMTNSFKKSTETINKAAADTLSFGDKLVVFKNKLTSALEPLGTTMTGIFEKWLDNSKPFLQSLEDMAVGFSKLEPSTQGWILALTAAGAAIGPLLAGVGLAAQGFASLAPVIAIALTGLTGFAGMVSNVGTAVATGMTGALTTGETALLRFGQAALIAAAAFAGWKLGEWLYNNTEAFHKFGDAFSEFVLRIPLLGTFAKYMTGLSQAQDDAANSTKAFETGVQGLAKTLAAQGIVVERGNKTWEEYGLALRQAVVESKNHGKELEVQDPKLKASEQEVARLKTQLQALMGGQTKAAAATKVHAQSLDQWVNSAIKFLEGSDKVKADLEHLWNLLDPASELERAEKKLEEGMRGIVNVVQKHTPEVEKVFRGLLEGSFANIAPTIETANKALAKFGVMSPTDVEKNLSDIRTNLDAIETMYASSANEINNYALIGLAELQQSRMKAAQDEIELRRKTGKDVSDELIRSLERQTVAYRTAHMDIEQAWKTLGITTTAQFDDQVKVAIAAYQKIKDSALSSHQDILKADAALYAAQLDAQEAAGVRVTESQKRQLANMLQVAKEGHKTLLTQWDLFANQLGDAVAKGLDDFVLSALTGKIKGIKDLFNSLWQDIAKSMVVSFIHPATEQIGDWLASSLTGLVKKGLASALGGVASGSGEAVEISNKILGGAGVASGSGEAVGTTLQMGDDIAGAATKAATGTASKAGTAGAGGLGSASSIIGIAGVVVDAAAGITAGLQMAHLISTAGKIEVNTREMSTVMWQTGAESIQGLLKDIRNTILKVNDRLVDVREALFAPVAITLELIDQSIKALGLNIATGVDTSADAVGALSEGLQTSIDQINSNHLEELAVANGIAGASNLSAQELKNLDSLTATATSQSISTGQTIANTVADSGNHIVSAVDGASALASSQATNDRVVALQQLESLGGMAAELQSMGADFTNAWSDVSGQYDSIKTELAGKGMDGVAAESLAAQQRAYDKLHAQQMEAANSNAAEWERIEGALNFMAGRDLGGVKYDKAFQGSTITNPLAAAMPTYNPFLASPSISRAPIATYDPSALISPLGVPGVAAYSRTPTNGAPKVYADSLTNPNITINMNNGTFTDKNFAKTVATEIATEVQRNLNY